MHMDIAPMNNRLTTHAHRPHQRKPVSAYHPLRFSNISDQLDNRQSKSNRKFLDIGPHLCCLSALDNIGNPMPKANSGRIVVAVDPHLKRRLYSVLAMENSTLKDWFIRSAEDYIDEKHKPTERFDSAGTKE